jgi:hypothetical protein
LMPVDPARLSIPDASASAIIRSASQAWLDQSWQG